MQKAKKNFSEIHSWRQWAVYDPSYDRPEMARLLRDPESGLQDRILKADTTTTVGLTQINGDFFVIKRFNIKGFWHGLKRAIQPTRAFYCWRNAHQLLALGIGTPKPIACIEKRWGPFRKQGYYIYEFVAGSLAETFFTLAEPSQEHLEHWAKQTMHILFKMQKHSIRHRDLKATNIIIGQKQIYLIDLDAMRAYKNKHFFKRVGFKDMDRFFENWKDSPYIKALFLKYMEA